MAPDDNKHVKKKQKCRDFYKTPSGCIFFLVCFYLNKALLVLVSEVFWGDGLINSHIKSALDETTTDTDENIALACTGNKFSTSHLESFRCQQGEKINSPFINDHCMQK